MAEPKPRIREVIVVEGRYDKNALSQVVDALIFETGGFSIFHNREKLEALRMLAEQRGLIILTDSDGAGFVIRSKLKEILPEESLCSGTGRKGKKKAEALKAGPAGRGGHAAGGASGNTAPGGSNGE